MILSIILTTKEEERGIVTGKKRGIELDNERGDKSKEDRDSQKERGNKRKKRKREKTNRGKQDISKKNLYLPSSVPSP